MHPISQPLVVTFDRSLECFGLGFYREAQFLLHFLISNFSLEAEVWKAKKTNLNYKALL